MKENIGLLYGAALSMAAALAAAHILLANVMFISCLSYNYCVNLSDMTKHQLFEFIFLSGHPWSNGHFAIHFLRDKRPKKTQNTPKKYVLLSPPKVSFYNSKLS